MIEHDTFEEWLRAHCQDLRNNLAPVSVQGELDYIKALSMALAVTDVLNAWNFYDNHTYHGTSLAEPAPDDVSEMRE